MNVIKNLITDLREKRLWPLAVVLILALIAVPVLISSNSSAPVIPAAPVVGASTPVPALPAVSVTPTPSNARLTGPARDPFVQQVKATSSTSKAGSSSAAAVASTSPGSSAAVSNATKASSGSTNSSSGATKGSTETHTTTTTTPTPKHPTPKPPTLNAAGLTPTQAFRIALSLTNPTGGSYTLDKVERLSVLPSRQRPLLIDLGVLKGGHRVLFAVEPGVVVKGPGACTPSPLDCQILSLKPNQIEAVAMRMPNGSISGALMAVTTIQAAGYGSSSAAHKARLAESAAGRRLLKAAKLKAVSHFAYRASLGAVVDLRTAAGGS
jgi:hypothetical protein